MKRRLLNLLTAVSLVLCIAVCVLWVRSMGVRDVLSSADVPSPHVWQSYRLVTVRGGFLFEFYQLEKTTSTFSPDNARPFQWQQFDQGNTTTDWMVETSERTFGIHVSPFDWPSLMPQSALDAPHFELNLDRVEDAYFVNTWRGVIVPWWQLCVALAIVMVVRVSLAAYRFARRESRDRVGHCISCGYNLTANLSGVCPECGEEAKPG